LIRGGYLVSPAEKPLLQKDMWVDGHLDGVITAQPAGAADFRVVHKYLRGF
jgi:hypothetical protein